jgi:hypothetical protein
MLISILIIDKHKGSTKKLFRRFKKDASDLKVTLKVIIWVVPITSIKCGIVGKLMSSGPWEKYLKKILGPHGYDLSNLRTFLFLK